MAFIYKLDINKTSRLSAQFKSEKKKKLEEKLGRKLTDAEFYQIANIIKPDTTRKK